VGESEGDILGDSVGASVGDDENISFTSRGTKGLTFFTVPGCFFSNLLTGFKATYVSGVLIVASPSKPKRRESSHSRALGMSL
jgi:hypothetical protein